MIADGFENGLGAWFVTGTGAPWTESTLDPYTGSRHAYAVQPGVSTMTYLERTFILAAVRQGGNLIYYRRLIGLDGADEFVARVLRRLVARARSDRQRERERRRLRPEGVRPAGGGDEAPLRLHGGCGEREVRGGRRQPVRPVTPAEVDLIAGSA